MLMLKKILKLIIILAFPVNSLFAADIPIIVIAPSKKEQSISTVGSSVVVYDEKDIENSTDYFLGDVLNFGTPSLNSYQQGGHGTISGIQLRGLPKRYSTVYIDGVKMSDPSTVSNDYWFDDILKNQISRVEILRGNQSSVYGSGSMGGTVNITTKRGKPGLQKNISYNTGSHSVHDLAFSISGADEKNDFYVGFERFETSGISAMTDNDEKDAYRNGTIVANYGYKISDVLKFESNYRFTDTFLEYDTEDSAYCISCNDNNTAHTKDSNGSIGFVYNPNVKFTNQLKFANTYSKRGYDEYDKWGEGFKEDFYRGFRNAIYYSGIYNINLDNSLTFGLEKEFDEMDWEKSGSDYNRGEEIVSKYIDFQSRITKNLFATAGLRFDEHSKAGNEDSHRVSLAYLFDNKLTKLKTSYGTSFRFPSLYELYTVYGSKVYDMKAETGKSFDIGIEKSFVNPGFKFDLTYFSHKYHDTLDGWKDGASDSNSYYHNQDGLVKSQGLEFISKWKKNDFLNFDLNYTYTSTYDGADEDDLKDGYTSSGAFLDKRMVRIPRHLVNLKTVFLIPSKKLGFTLETKWSDDMRDYGNYNSPKHGSDYADVKLDDFLVNNLTVNYNLYDYKAFFKINNILDEKYNTALDYSQMDRTFNFGIKRVY